MKIKMLTPISGVFYSATGGEEIDVDDAEGKRLIEAGLAVSAPKAKRSTKRETRTVSAPEVAADVEV